MVSKLDIDKLTILIAGIHWDSIFSRSMNSGFRTYIHELRDIRITYVAHTGSETIDDRDLYRAFDTMIRIVEDIGNESMGKELQSLLDYQPTTITEEPKTLDHAISLLTRDRKKGYSILKVLADQGSWQAKHLRYVSEVTPKVRVLC